MVVKSATDPKRTMKREFNLDILILNHKIKKKETKVATQQPQSPAKVALSHLRSHNVA